MLPRDITDALGRISRKLAVVRSAISTTRPTLPLHPCLTEAEIVTFERRYGTTLPDEYRAFLLHMGNGGAGPDEGLFPLKLDWGDGDPHFGRPFPVSTAQAREVISRPPDERFLDVVGDPRDGTIPGCLQITSAPCATGALLILTGEQRGTVWYDTDVGGRLVPCHDSQGRQLGFLDWYEDWLDQWLQEIAQTRADYLRSQGFDLE